MCFEFVERNAAIEILIHLPHDLVDLLFRYCEPESFKKVLELVTLNEAVLIRVYLVEDLC